MSVKCPVCKQMFILEEYMNSDYYACSVECFTKLRVSIISVGLYEALRLIEKATEILKRDEDGE